MNTQIETKLSKLDTAKWLLIVALVTTGVIGHYLFADQPGAVLLVAWLGLVAVIGFIAAQTDKGKQAIAFAKEARTELRKVVWPTRQETIRMTGLVALMVVITSLILWGLDSILLWVVRILTGQ